MPFSSVRLVPGVDTEKTPSLNEAGISSSSFIRWKEGIPEKRGGWSKFIPSPLPYLGREGHAWEDINTNLRLAVGTSAALYQITSGTVSDITAQSGTYSIPVSVSTTAGSAIVIVEDTDRFATVYDAVVFNTPISVGGVVLSGAYQVYESGGVDRYQLLASTEATSTVTNGGVVPEFTASAGSSLVTVYLPAHGMTAGEYFSSTISTVVSGITIKGNYIIQSITDADHFVISTNVAATTNASAYMNGGNASITYYFVNGPLIIGAGYGIGPYGRGKYGTGVTSVAPTYPNITASDYWLDNWGEILVSCPVNGPIFTWSPESGNKNSSMISQGPVVNAGMFIAMPEQQIMAWGSTYTLIGDPLQIRWCDAGNYSVWTPTAANQAGGFRLPTGSRIVRGLQGPQNTLWFTDIDLYIGTYVGLPDIWGFSKVAGSCGLIAPKAAGVLGVNVYWMSQKQFFVYTGGAVQPIPCKVWDVVFQNLNSAYVANIRCGTNAQFNEVIWFFPSAASAGENDTYVSLNTVTGEWDIGPLGRTFWIDQSVLGGPIGGGPDGDIYQHEVSPDGDGSAISASLTTGYFCLSEGQEMCFVDWMMPDFVYGTYSGTPGASISITINVVDYIGDVPRVYGPYVVTQGTEFIAPRFRGRFVQLVISSNDLGSFWRLGRIRYRFQADGRR